MRQRERGTAILITMLITVALIGGGAVLVGMQMASTRSTDVARSNMTSLYCAEAGLNAARKIVAQNFTTDNTFNGGLTVGAACNDDSTCTGGALCIQVGAGNFCMTQPAFLANGPNVNHDLLATGSDDFYVVIVDNEDEVTFTNDYTKDNDLHVFIVSTCTRFPDNKKQVRELVRIKPGLKDYDSQLGGAGGNSNANVRGD